MGLFDTFIFKGKGCPEHRGHFLNDDFQTKDMGRLMQTFKIGDNINKSDSFKIIDGKAICYSHCDVDDCRLKHYWAIIKNGKFIGIKRAKKYD